MIPIELRILAHNEETVLAEDLELEIHPTDFDTKPVYFYSIDNIQPMIIKEVDLSIVSSGGDDFICATPFEKLKVMIERNNKKTI